VGQAVDDFDASETNGRSARHQNYCSPPEMVLVLRNRERPDANLGEEHVRRLFDLSEDLEVLRVSHVDRHIRCIAGHAFEARPKLRRP